MKVLVADDDAVSRRLLEHTLTRLGHEVMSMSDGSKALEALLLPDGPRLAILDWMMPGADGLTVCRQVREKSPTYVYLILLTARDGQGDVVTALDSGADDFLTKPFDLGELRARLRAGERVLELQTRLLKAHEALSDQAARDYLTGLWNRRMIIEQLGREVNRARHESKPMSVALFDLDGFKQINDTFGHAGGDAVLREAAAIMRAQLRDYDFIGRYGGEEFLAVLPGCDAAAAKVIAERVRVRLAAEPVRIGTSGVKVTTSAGVGSSDTAGLDGKELIQRADEALYRAKEYGRNRVEN